MSLSDFVSCSSSLLSLSLCSSVCPPSLPPPLPLHPRKAKNSHVILRRMTSILLLSPVHSAPLAVRLVLIAITTCYSGRPKANGVGCCLAITKRFSHTGLWVFNLTPWPYPRGFHIIIGPWVFTLTPWPYPRGFHIQVHGFSPLLPGHTQEVFTLL